MKKQYLGFTLTAAIALAIASVSSAQEIIERVQVQAGEMPVTITTYAPTIEAASLANEAVLPIEKYGDSTAYVTWESGGYLYQFVDSKTGRVYAISLNAGEKLDALSKLVGVALNNPIVIPAIEYQAKDVSVSAKAAPPAGWGRVLATYRGVDSYFNGTDPNYINGQSQYGYRWHCVEYVIRFYATAMGRNIRGQGGNALTYWTNAASHNLTRYANGGGTPPKTGDVLVSTYGTYGHVAVATNVVLPTSTANGYVDLIQQNWGSTGTMRLTLRRIAPTTVGGVVNYQLSNFSTSYSVAGWAR